jgi:Bacterial regulatory proteins, tetR family/Tetracyclin repressor-like, C-terminal domain
MEGRVPRNTLSRDRIVDAALELLDTEGLDALTMPKLARRLGVGTMSLYRHVADKDDLVNSVAERVLDAVAVPDGPPDDWEGRVVGYLTALRQAALAHPSLSRILAERGLTVGPVFDQLEQAHAILRAAGFSTSRPTRRCETYGPTSSPPPHPSSSTMGFVASSTRSSRLAEYGSLVASAHTRCHRPIRADHSAGGVRAVRVWR